MITKSKNKISCVTWTAEKVYSADMGTVGLSLKGEVEITLITEGSGIYRGPEESRECHAGELFVFDSIRYITIFTFFDDLFEVFSIIAFEVADVFLSEISKQLYPP